MPYKKYPMKSFQIILFAFVALISSCTAPKQRASAEIETPTQQLEGTWVLTYAKETYPDTVIEAAIFDQTKILVDGRFAIGYYRPDSSLFAGGGTYAYDGQIYTENIEYSTNDVVGQSVKFEATVENDILSISGSVLVEIGDKIIDLELYETWKRKK